MSWACPCSWSEGRTVTLVFSWSLDKLLPHMAALLRETRMVGGGGARSTWWGSELGEEKALVAWRILLTPSLFFSSPYSTSFLGRKGNLFFARLYQRGCATGSWLTTVLTATHPSYPLWLLLSVSTWQRLETKSRVAGDSCEGFFLIDFLSIWGKDPPQIRIFLLKKIHFKPGLFLLVTIYIEDMGEGSEVLPLLALCCWPSPSLAISFRQ